MGQQVYFAAEGKFGNVNHGSHRLEKNYFETNLPWKVLKNYSEALKKSWILLFFVRINPFNGNKNLYKIVVFIGAAYAFIPIVAASSSCISETISWVHVLT